ncbi:pre-mRNA 3'-end-processing factor FIP1-like isoform X5 [Osmerus eperlanus]|uniref:pre-mRNA 3'-end-processing factor FIP1-like isoform X5 n=1 Tax=Osmerus eperlanus TaxID=29151 RepID=UPI002E13AE69
MSAEETDKTTDGSGGEDEEEWLYGDEGEEGAEQSEPDRGAAQPAEGETLQQGGEEKAEKEAVQEEGASDSDSDDDDDDVCVTIGNIKSGGSSQYSVFGASPVNLNIKTDGRTHSAVGSRPRGVDLQAGGSISGLPVMEVDVESLEDKPWRKPGADISDYFNYGFNEDTWKSHCEKQRRLRANYEGLPSTKILVQQGRMCHGEKGGRSEYSSSRSSRISSGTIDVIGGQSGCISRVEGRRRPNSEGNNIQVVSQPSSDAEAPPTKMSPFFPPNIPPPPFLPPPNVSSAPPLIPPPRIPISVPPPGFPLLPGAPPPSLLPSLDSSHCEGYDGPPAPPFPFPPGVYPPIPGWPGVIDSAKAWEYFSRQERERERGHDKDRERGRERAHDKERERGRDRERQHSPSSPLYHSEEERPHHRDHEERGYRDRYSRERRLRDKDEGRHKSSRSSSRRKQDSEEGDGHRRHKHKKSRRSREDKETNDEPSADQENQSGAAK